AVVLLCAGLCPGLGRSPDDNQRSSEGRRLSAHQTAKPRQVSQSGVPSVTKVEPPSWWARHSINPVRLLVQGENLTGARVLATKTAIQTSEVFVNRNGTYLFVNVRVSPTARPGSYPLTLVTPQGNT